MREINERVKAEDIVKGDIILIARSSCLARAEVMKTPSKSKKQPGPNNTVRWTAVKIKINVARMPSYFYNNVQHYYDRPTTEKTEEFIEKNLDMNYSEAWLLERSAL